MRFRLGATEWGAVFLAVGLVASPLHAEDAVQKADLAASSPTPEQRARISEAAFQFARAKLLADEGAFDEASGAYSRALELDGSDPYSRIEVAKFHSYLAQISRNSQKRLDYLQSAAGYAAEARLLAPDNLEILQSFAQIHLRLGERELAALDQALEAYEEIRSKTEGDLQVLTSLGQIYLWKQESDKAVEVLEEASSYLPNHRMIQTMLLESYLGTGRKSEAEDVLSKLTEIEPDSVEHRLRLAELRSERGAHRAAVSGLVGAPETVRSNPRLRRILAQELHLAGSHDEALALADSLLSESPSEPGVRRLRVAILSSLTRYEEAVAELGPILAEERDKGRALQGAFHFSRLLERLGRLGEAAGVLRQQLGNHDVAGQMQLKLTLVGVLERQERSEEAIELLEVELDRVNNSHLPMLARALSDVLARQQRTEEALGVIEKAIGHLEADTTQVEASERLRLRKMILLAGAEEWQRLEVELPSLFGASSADIRAASRLLFADALAGLDRTDEALESIASEGNGLSAERQLTKRVELLFESGRDSEADKLLNEIAGRGEVEDLFLAAQAYQRAERYDESIPLLEKVLAQQKDSQQALFLLGAGNERAGNRDAAASAFKKLLDLEPDHSPTLNYLGYMWAELGQNLSEAVKLIQRAVSLEPDNGAYVDSLGWAYFRLGKFVEAREHLEWAVRLSPDDPTVREHLGDLYVAIEEIEHARASYEQALDLGIEDTETLRRKIQTLDEKDL